MYIFPLSSGLKAILRLENQNEIYLPENISSLTNDFVSMTENQANLLWLEDFSTKFLLRLTNYSNIWVLPELFFGRLILSLLKYSTYPWHFWNPIQLESRGITKSLPVLLDNFLFGNNLLSNSTVFGFLALNPISKENRF